MQSKKTRNHNELNENVFIKSPIKPIDTTYNNKPKHQNKNKKKNTKKPKSKKKKTALVSSIVAIVLAIIVAICVWLYLLANTNLNDEDFDSSVLKSTEHNEPFYMVLVGTDTREAEGEIKLTEGRSDTCMLVRVDPVHNYVSMISIPRDTKIYYNGSYEKFNSVYYTDRIEGTIKQVNKMFNVEVSHYAEISFNGLKDMVDAVGGVEINITEAVSDSKVDDQIKAGRQTLNGSQALSYSRSRNYADGDFTRTAHQRELMKALIDKAMKLNLSELPNVLSVATKYVKTDFSAMDLYNIASKFKEAQAINLYTAMIPSTTGSEDGVSYVYMNREAALRMIKMVENLENPLMVDLTDQWVVTSDYEEQQLKQTRVQYYKDHPNSPGKASSTSTDTIYYYSQNDEYAKNYNSGYNSYKTDNTTESYNNQSNENTTKKNNYKSNTQNKSSSSSQQNKKN